ncbi:cytochrome P450 [Lentzea sp. NBRC 102530]|uniref:cytochrome P450 n=1 Tax=Lentzea sp. NBRC 102530 TaxID=3032201 RepID=UPI00255288D2|nr:cytochrome P450 [Lentzea sp. NBRC 102530]
MTDVHVLDPARHLPQAEVTRLRSSGPAARVELPGGVMAWSVTRYDVVRRLAEDDRLSRDARQHWPGLAEVPEGWPLAPFLLSPTVLNAYGADHRRLRDVMEAAFAPERLEQLGAHLIRRLPGLLAELGAPGSGQVVDVRADFAQVIAGETLCDLFGVPRERWADARGAMSDLLSPSEDPGVAAAQLDSALGFLAGLVESKRTSPAADMASTLAHDPGMTDEERVLALAVTIAGGVPATTDLIANAVADLLGHPDQLAAAVDGEVSWSEVVDETLRFDAPVQHMPLRYAVQDIDLGEGVVIRRGDPVLLGFGAGGRDPERHGDTAAVFDVHRLDKAHVAFGHGVHRCIGARLGRIEATLALAALFEHFPGLEPAVDVGTLRPLPTFVFGGRTEVPVRL